MIVTQMIKKIMESEGLLPCPHVPITGFYPEAFESSL
jgi:hypothetical protein